MAEMSLEENPVPDDLVCHTEAFGFYVKDSGGLLKDFKLGYNMNRNENVKDYSLTRRG